MNRTELLLGEDAKKLKNSSAAIFGLGGVGGYCAEFLARAGVGRLALADSDSISESNLNRQVLALSSTVGRKKTSVCAERIGQINGEIKAAFWKRRAGMPPPASPMFPPPQPRKWRSTP